MKKINMLIIGTMISVSSIAQQTSISKVADVGIPKGVERLDKEQMVAHSKKLFKHTEMGTLKTNNIYKIGDISIAFWDIFSSSDKRSLDDIKNQDLELVKLDKNIIVINATIKNIHNKNFYIVNYQNGDVDYYRFTSEPRNNKTLNGIIEYKNSDKDQAKAILDDLLKSVKFKE